MAMKSETEKIGDSFGDGTLLMENKSAQNRREFKREYFVLAAAFQREPFSLSNLAFQVEEHF